MRTFSKITLAATALAATSLVGTPGWAHEHTHGGAHSAGTSPTKPAKAPVRMTMEELHKHGGVPPHWRFALPAGDAQAGREVFVAVKCYTCHDVSGETFPAHKRDVGEVGPDLAGMGSLHPAEYFAETILNPNAVILLGEGHTGRDGLSRMPDYNDTLTVRQLIDLVAYLKSLKGGHGDAQPGMRHDGSRMPHPGPGPHHPKGR